MNERNPIQKRYVLDTKSRSAGIRRSRSVDLLELPNLLIEQEEEEEDVFHTPPSSATIIGDILFKPDIDTLSNKSKNSFPPRDKKTAQKTGTENPEPKVLHQIGNEHKRTSSDDSNRGRVFPPPKKNTSRIKMQKNYTENEPNSVPKTIPRRLSPNRTDNIRDGGSLSPRRKTMRPLIKISSTPKKSKKPFLQNKSRRNLRKTDSSSGVPDDSINSSINEIYGDSTTDEASSDGAEEITAAAAAAAAAADPLTYGISLFNHDWKDGIAYLKAMKVIEDEAGDYSPIVHFICHNNDRLSKIQLGDFIAGKDDEDILLLKAFTNSMNFIGEEIIASLRKYLGLFRLPGESQKIHRIIHQFAEKYQLDNPDVLPTTDAAFLLAYSIIILNTSIHNPAIPDKDKMTIIDFHNGLKDERSLETTWKGNVPNELIEKIYQSITLNELKVNGDPDRKGWNKSIIAGNYKTGRLWFCLNKNELQWYKDFTQIKMIGKIILEYVRVREEGDTFSITSCLPQKIKFIVYTKGKPTLMKTIKFEIVCENVQLGESWAAAVRNNVTFDVVPEKESPVKQIKFKQKNSKKF